jgi:hypothetical protein
MASTTELLKAFGVRSISPYDPGIIKLAKVRSGVYPGIAPINITPTSEALQLLGKIDDPLKAYSMRNPNEFLDATLPKILGVVTGLVGGVGGALAVGAQKAALEVSKKPTTLRPTGGLMAFEDGDSGFGFGDFFGGVGKVLQGQLGRDLLSLGTQAGSQYISQQFAPQPGFAGGSFGSPAPTSLAMVPAIARGGAMVARGFFNRFPNLALGIQALRNKGANVTRSSLYSLMKRFGPDFLIGGAILSASAVSELAMAGPGRRRMNPGNVKALRRAHRRMKAFHNVCRTNDTLLTHRRGKARSTFGRGTTITQVK